MSVSPSPNPYTNKAELYDQSRWRYPEALLDWVFETFSIGPSASVAEVGAGTGILTEELAQRLDSLLAVEPDPAMAEVLAQKKIRGVRLLERLAHELDAPDHSLDFVFVAHALHWFDYERTVSAFARKLKPKGFLVNITNRHVGNSELQERCQERLFPFFVPRPTQSMHQVLDYFEDGSLVEKGFPFEFRNTEEQFLMGLSSASFYPDPSQGELYLAFAQQVRTLFREFQHDGVIVQSCESVAQIGKIKVIEEGSPWTTTFA